MSANLTTVRETPAIRPHRMHGVQRCDLLIHGLSVCLSNCPLVKTVSPAKTDELIQMPFGLYTRIGPRNRILTGVPDPPGEGAKYKI